MSPLITASDGAVTLHSSRLERASTLSAEDLTLAVTEEYRRIAKTLVAQRRFPLRIWNFIPEIQAPAPCGDRYMAFNIGRFNAFADWFGSDGRFRAAVPTASGVGVRGDTLWIHVLAATTPGIAVENPRQIPAYQYSRRYGMRPPCFARATRYARTLFIGGTASIVGEDSCHQNSVATQTRETLANLSALIESAAGTTPCRGLQRLIDLRVHVAKAADAVVVESLLGEAIPGSCAVEFVEAELCRRELLVEIEGRADCG